MRSYLSSEENVSGKRHMQFGLIRHRMMGCQRDREQRMFPNGVIIAAPWRATVGRVPSRPAATTRGRQPQPSSQEGKEPVDSCHVHIIIVDDCEQSISSTTTRASSAAGISADANNTLLARMLQTTTSSAIR